MHLCSGRCYRRGGPSEPARLPATASRASPHPFPTPPPSPALLRCAQGAISDQAEPLGWNALVSRALRPAENQSALARGVGNFSVELVHERLLRLLLPTKVADSAYAISTPETVELTLPAAALTAAGAPLAASPPLRIAAPAGHATLAGTLIADRLPDDFVNVTARRFRTQTPDWQINNYISCSRKGGVGTDAPDGHTRAAVGGDAGELTIRSISCRFRPPSSHLVR